MVKQTLGKAALCNNVHPYKTNIVQNLNIPRFENDEPVVNNISDPTLKAILKYRKHPGVITIRDKFKIKETFSFVEVDQKEIEKEILNMDVKKHHRAVTSQQKLSKKTLIFSVILFALVSKIPLSLHAFMKI